MKNLYILTKNWIQGNKMTQPINVMNGLLYINNQQVPFLDNPVPKDSEGVNTCEYIICHYTGGTTVQSAHNTYLDPTTQVSWHLSVSRDGDVTQLLSFDKVAWHAGASSWGTGPQALVGMNKYSIGVEHSNCGPLTEKNGAYVTAFGQVVPNIDVGFDQNGNPWQLYSPQQLASSNYLILNFARILKVKDILGHEQIATPIGRKKDPGPMYWDTLADIRKTYANS